MKTKIMKILGVVMTVAMLASFMVAGAPVSAAGGPTTASINEWEGVVLPFTVEDCDVELIEQANDGTIFISVYFSAGGAKFNGVTMVADSYSMFKSTDGYTWTLTNVNNLQKVVSGPTTVAKRITAIEPSANYAVDKTVYVAVDTEEAGYTTLYRCTNTAAIGTPFSEMGQISPGVGTSFNATYIYDLDSYYDGSYVWLLAATDVDVFAIRDDKGLTTIWTDMQLSETLGGDYADVAADNGVTVFKAMFAADYASTGVIWAMYFDSKASPALAARFPTLTGDTDGYGIIARSSGSSLWGTVITPVIISAGGRDARAECDFEFSASYSSNTNPELYAALGFRGYTTADDIYRIECGFYGAAGNVSQFDVDPADRMDFCSLEVDGNVIIAGGFDRSFDTTEVWFSTNYGTSWSMASKNPTGEADYTCNVLISKFGSTAGKAFAATGGDQSAISISADNGDTWNQIAFIDDMIDAIIDVAFNPTNKSALLVTRNNVWDDSLWKTDDVTALNVKWQRVLCENYNTDINMSMVEYSNDGAAVMIWDRWADAIFRSTNDAQTFASWRNTASWGDINAWVVPNASTVYAATDMGFWSTALVGSRLSDQTLVSIAMSGDALAVGNDAGKAYASVNKGNTWGNAITCGGGSDDVFVAFDAMYASNNLFYYATEGGKVGQVLLNGNNQSTAAGSNKVLLDADDEAACHEHYSAIIVAPDNALYVAGYDEGYTITYGEGFYGSLTIRPGGILVPSYTFSDLEITDFVVTNGSFVEGAVEVIGEDLTLINQTTVVGRVYVQQGVAEAYFDYTYIRDGSTWSSAYVDNDCDVIAWNLTYEETESEMEYDGQGMCRLLLHQADNNWEGDVTQLNDMSGLWYSAGSNILWTIVDGVELHAFEDFLSGQTQGVAAVEVDKVAANPTKSVQVSWTHMNEDDGTTYLISYQATGSDTVNYTTKYVASTVAAGSSVNVKISGLSPSKEYTFKVRVANDSPIQSRWSNGVKVTTSAWLYAPTPISPSQYLVVASLHPTFTWSLVPAAVSYEFQLSASASFTTLIDTVTIALTGYTYTGDALDYDTDYYWRVRAIGVDASQSVWSSYSIWDTMSASFVATGAPSVFHTMVDPADYQSELTVTQTEVTLTVSSTVTSITNVIPVPEFTVTVQPAQTTVTTQTHTLTIPDKATPAYIWAIVAIGALLTIAVIVLIIRTRRVV